MSDKPQMIIGRVVKLDNGQTYIKPLEHRREVLAQQQAIQDLIQAAREWNAQPNTITAERLFRMAKRV